MQIKTIDNKFFSCKLFLTNAKGQRISFEECIEIKSNSKFPHKLLFFKIKENKMFTNMKIKNADSILKIMEIKFHSKISYPKLCQVLKTFLPTVFDKKSILKQNNESDLNEYSTFLIKAVQEIFDEEEFVKYKNQLECNFKDEFGSFSSDGSILSFISDICSDELIDV